MADAIYGGATIEATQNDIIKPGNALRGNTVLL